MPSAANPTVSPGAKPFGDVLEEHWDDLDFLILQRDEIVFDKDYNLVELAEFEGRIEAHIDGLRIAGERGLEQARAVLADGDNEGAVQAAVRLLSESNEGDAALIEAMREGPSWQVARGLRHAHAEALARLGGPLLECAGDGSNPVASAAARDALTFHRLAAPTPSESLWSHEDPDVRSATWQSAARMDILGPSHVAQALEEPHPPVREAAFRALAIGGVPELLGALRSAAFQSVDTSDPVAIRMLGILGSTVDAQALTQRAASTAEDADGNEGALCNAALDALGALGATATLSPLAQAVDHEATRGAALDAWSRITGLDPDPETASSAQLEHVGKAWLEGKNPDAPFQAGHEAPPNAWSTVPHLPLRSRRDLYTAARLNGAAPTVELEAAARLQSR